MLFAYKIFYGAIAGVLVDTSLENAKVRVREHYKDDEKYLQYRRKHKILMADDDSEPIIEIYDLSKRFEDNISGIYELTI